MRQRNVLNLGIEIKATQAEPETMVWGNISMSRERSLNLTHNDPVQDLESRLTNEEVVYGRNERASNDDGDPCQVHHMPQLFHFMRVRLHQVVDSAGEQTELAREEEDGEHDPVCRQHIVVLGLGKHPHVDVRDRPYQYRADQVGVYIAGLVV